MLIFPQLVTGALSQFPVKKQQRQRTVINTSADNYNTRLDDPPAATTLWTLQYTNLNDSEIQALAAFFESTEGSLNAFTFLDPAGNLLAWSEDLTNAVWTKDPELTLTANVGDPFGGTGAFHFANAGAGPQGISQTLNSPTSYQYTFSVYARSASPASLTIQAGAKSIACVLTANWQRFFVVGSAASGATAVEFQIEAPGFSAVDIFGPQAESQWAPSAYKKSSTGGVYQNARFNDDVFTYTTTDVNRHSATVNILYANHL
jgi:hypothetical protein